MFAVWLKLPRGATVTGERLLRVRICGGSTLLLLSSALTYPCVTARLSRPRLLHSVTPVRSTMAKLSPQAELHPDQFTLVIPCYNEEKRLNPSEIARLSREDGLTVLLVDDGSSDGTAALAEGLVSQSNGKIDFLQLEQNGGKAEAVRRGLLHALDNGANCVGFLDADLSTPVDEMLRLVQYMRERPAITVVLASRIRLLGNDVQRKPHRHYLGRLFATAASLTLDLDIYDTQCGAKLFRNGPALRSALGRPFTSRWIFDVELIGRLIYGAPAEHALTAEQFAEVPLRTWRDVAGSKLRPQHMFRAIGELAQLQHQFKQMRAHH